MPAYRNEAKLRADMVFDVRLLLLTMLCSGSEPTVISPEISTISNKEGSVSCDPSNKDDILCPEGLSNEDSEHCFSFTVGKPFQCPYPNHIPFGYIPPAIKHTIRDAGIWAEARLNRTLGDYYWEGRESYGEPLKIHDLDFEKECVIMLNHTLKSANCSEYHYNLCVYSRQFTTFCSRATNLECIPSSFDVGDSIECYCRNNSCENPVEPKFPFQTRLLLDNFFHVRQTCHIGLRNNYTWLSGDPVEYNYWSDKVNCEDDLGALRFHNDVGWTFTKEKKNCTLCQSTIPIPTAKIELKPRGKVIDLIVTNGSSISEMFGRFDIFCFTDANNDQFQTRVLMVPHSSNKLKLVLWPIGQPGHYWCVAFQIDGQKIYSNTVIAYNQYIGYGHEYVAEISIRRQHGNPISKNDHALVCEIIFWQLGGKKVMSVRPMRVSKYDSENLHFLAHLTTSKSNISASQEYQELATCLGGLTIENATIESFRSCEVCPEAKTLTGSGKVLRWPETKIGETATPTNVICLENRGKETVPVTRTCEGNFLEGTRWSKVHGDDCSSGAVSEVTEELFTMLKNNNSQEVGQKLVEITAKYAQTSQAIDIHLISQILKAHLELKSVNETVLNVISNMMNYNREVLKQAQLLLNSTDELLYTLDRYLRKWDEENMVLNKIAVIKAEIGWNNFSGVGLFKSGSSAPIAFELLDKNSTIEELVKNTSLDSAILFSPELIEQIANKSSVNSVIFTVFYNDFLFNDDAKENYSIIHNVLSVFVPNFNDDLQSPIRMLFRSPQSVPDSSGRNCSHWKYGFDEFTGGTYGEWKMNSVANNLGDFEICEFYHMTHFGLLLPFMKNNSVNSTHSRALNIITTVGLSFSTAGVFCIFVTAIVFPKWRNNRGYTILLHYCVVILLHTFSLMVTEIAKNNEAVCVLIGVALHYTQLAEFCWMLVIAILLYTKFVTVFTNTKSSFTQMCFPWTFPLLPILVCLVTKGYASAHAGFCYPSGLHLILGLILPICIFLITKLVLFTLIFYSISRQNAPMDPIRKSNYKVEICLGLLLFFMLDITWLLGLVGSLSGEVLFTYLFCIAATVRGFILFLFFIVANTETRLMWRKYYDRYITRSKGHSKPLKT